MKTVIVNVQIQIDIPTKNLVHGEVLWVGNVLDEVNQAIQEADLESQPQILTGALDSADIIEQPVEDEEEY